MIDYNKLHIKSKVRFKLLSLEWQYNFCKALADSHNVEHEKQARYGYALRRMFEEASCDIDNELIVGRASLRRLSDYEEYEWGAIKRWVMQDDIWDSEMGICIEIDLEEVLEHGLEYLVESFGEKLEMLDRTNPENISKYNFYKSGISAIQGVMIFADRYHEDIIELIQKSSSLKKKAELRAINKNLAQVPRYGANTLYQALQMVHLITVCIAIKPYMIIKIKDMIPLMERYYEKDKAKGDKAFLKVRGYINSFLKMQAKCNPIGFDLFKLTLNSDEYSEQTMAKDSFLSIVKDLIGGIKSNSKKGYDILEECGEYSLNAFVTYMGFISMSKINFVNAVKHVIGVNQDQSIKLIVNFETLKEKCQEKVSSIIKNIVIAENTKLYENNNSQFHLIASSLNPHCVEVGKDITQNNGKFSDVLLTFSEIDSMVTMLLQIKYMVYDKQYLSYMEYCDYLKNKRSLNKFGFEVDKQEFDDLRNEVREYIFEYCTGFSTTYGGKFIPYV